MNQFFSVSRFSLLVSKHWADNKKRYLFSVVGFILLLVIWFVLTLLVDPHRPMDEELQILTFFFTLFGTGMLYASQYFRDLGSRPKGINFLMVPASAFEKILCGILFTVVIFFAVFTAVFYLVDILMVFIANRFLLTGDPSAHQPVVNMFRAAILPFDKVSMINMLLLFFAAQSTFFLGSVYFTKYSFIKTVITGFVIFFLLFCLIYLLYARLMPAGEYEDVFLVSYRVVTRGADDYLVQLPHWVGVVIHFMIMYAIAPFAWVVTYYRLKEKQV
ncbi:MAG: hypothetical protein DI535_04910 [Citrobacter freundii]|nr:MAG: hypothetical protein DI535_04910 [Citrobacter freundii]